MDGDNHILVIKDAGNRERARVNCAIERLDGKVGEPKYDAFKNAAGETVFQSVEFAATRTSSTVTP